MEHLCDMGHLESSFGLFRDSVSVGARLVNGLCQTCHNFRKLFRMHRMALLGYEAQLEAHFSSFDIMQILTQDRCTVWAICTMASETILDAPDGTPR
jgi:hypothetical protein